MTIVSDTEILTESHLKSEKKTNEQNSRRRTRSIGRSKKTPAVNQLEAKAASYRQELDTAEISLFLRSDSGVQREGRKGERRFALTPTPPPRCCCCFFFLLTSLCAVSTI